MYLRGSAQSFCLDKFDPSQIPVDAEIKSARLVLTHRIYDAGTMATQNEFTYHVHNVNEYWDENLYFDFERNAVESTMYPLIDQSIEAEITGDITGDKVVETDITNLVNRWVSGESENNGICVDVDSWAYEHDKEVRIINNVLYGYGTANAPKIIVEYY